MNREQRRLVNEVSCIKSDAPWMFDATLIIHGRWNRKSKPYAVGNLRTRKSITELENWEALSKVMPVNEIDLCFSLHGAVLYYDTPGFTRDEMLEATIDKLPELSLDDDYCAEVHDRVMRHAYGGMVSSRQFRQNRVCTCSPCHYKGEFNLKTRKGWPMTYLTLVRLLDLSAIVPQNILEEIEILRAQAFDALTKTGLGVVTDSV